MGEGQWGKGLNPDLTQGARRGHGLECGNASRREGLFCEGLSERGVVSSARSVLCLQAVSEWTSRTQAVNKAPRLAVFN